MKSELRMALSFIISEREKKLNLVTKVILKFIHPKTNYILGSEIDFVEIR